MISGMRSMKFIYALAGLVGLVIAGFLINQSVTSRTVEAALSDLESRYVTSRFIIMWMEYAGGEMKSIENIIFQFDEERRIAEEVMRREAELLGKPNLQFQLTPGATQALKEAQEKLNKYQNLVNNGPRDIAKQISTLSAEDQKILIEKLRELLNKKAEAGGPLDEVLTIRKIQQEVVEQNRLHRSPAELEAAAREAEKDFENFQREVSKMAAERKAQAEQAGLKALETLRAEEVKKAGGKTAELVQNLENNVKVQENLLGIEEELRLRKVLELAEAEENLQKGRIMKEMGAKLTPKAEGCLKGLESRIARLKREIESINNRMAGILKKIEEYSMRLRTTVETAKAAEAARAAEVARAAGIARYARIMGWFTGALVGVDIADLLLRSPEERVNIAMEAALARYQYALGFWNLQSVSGELGPVLKYQTDLIIGGTGKLPEAEARRILEAVMYDYFDVSKERAEKIREIRQELRDYIKWDMKSLKELYPKIDWDDYIGQLNRSINRR